jgi:hypothetical protein
MTEPRINPHNGQPCPAWCAAGHADPDASPSCAGPEHAVKDPGGLTIATAQARLFPGDKGPEVVSYAHGAGLAGPLGAAWAGTSYHGAKLADFVDRLAEMQPGDLRGLAGKIREASAEAWPEAEAG